MMRSSRSFVLSAFLAAAGAVSTVSAPAFADDGGAGGSATTTDPSCTIGTESVAGTTCAQCIVTSSDTSCQTELGVDYNYVCTNKTTSEYSIQIWCNGPDRDEQPDLDATSCAVPSSVMSNAGGFGLLAIGAMFVAAARRRRRK